MKWFLAMRESPISANMSGLEQILSLFVAAVVLAAVARRVGAPYPVFLALGGACYYVWHANKRVAKRALSTDAKTSGLDLTPVYGEF